MEEDFITEQVGHMILRKNKKTGEVIEWTTFSENIPLDVANRRFKALVILSKEMPLIKQIAKIKALRLKLDIEDKEMINFAKSNGYIELGYYRPNEGEEIFEKASKLGIKILLEEIYI